MNPFGTLSEMAGAEIAALQAEGITLTPEEIVEINALGWRIENPSTRMLLAKGRAVFVGGAVLWPLTFRAVAWLDMNEIPLDRCSPGMAYAMAHGGSEGPEMDSCGKEATRAVKRWVKTLLATEAELNEAVRQVDNQSDSLELPPDHSGRPMSRGDFVAFMQATCGEDADFWERRCCVDHALNVLAQFVMHNMASKTPCAQDPKIIAEKAMGWAIEKIKIRHTAGVITNG